MEEQRNIRPNEGSSLPGATFAVLVLIIIGMLYIGWEYLADRPGETLTSPKISQESAQSVEKEIVEEEVKPKIIDVAQEGVDAGNQKPIEKKETPKPEKKPEKIVEPKQPKVEVAEKETLKPEIEKEKVTLPKGGLSQTHVVDIGETFYGLANRYNMKWSTLKALNPKIKDVNKDFKVGVTKVNLRVKAIHTVEAGDVLRKVAQKYGISKELLMLANGKTKDLTERGEKLIIPYAEKE
jgi:LysM repeat protein